MPRSSTEGYATLPIPPPRGGSKDQHVQSLLISPVSRQVISPQRQAVMAVLPREDRMSMSHQDAVAETNKRMATLGAPKVAGILTFAEVHEAARRVPDYEVLRRRMEARRDGRDPDEVAPVGPKRVCPECGSDQISVREAHADTGMDEMEGRCRECKHCADVSKFYPAKTAALDAAPDGGENHPPLLSNPFMGDPKNAPEYQNGYQYAQALGHQQLNVATDGDVQRWVGAAAPWVAGFCAGARSLGVGRLADTIEAYKPAIKQGSVMDDLDLNDTFASEAIKTAFDVESIMNNAMLPDPLPPQIAATIPHHVPGALNYAAALNTAMDSVPGRYVETPEAFQTNHGGQVQDTRLKLLGFDKGMWPLDNHHNMAQLNEMDAAQAAAYSRLHGGHHAEELAKAYDSQVTPEAPPAPKPKLYGPTGVVLQDSRAASPWSSPMQPVQPYKTSGAPMIDDLNDTFATHALKTAGLSPQALEHLSDATGDFKQVERLRQTPQEFAAQAIAHGLETGAIKPGQEQAATQHLFGLMNNIAAGTDYDSTYGAGHNQKLQALLKTAGPLLTTGTTLLGAGLGSMIGSGINGGDTTTSIQNTSGTESEAHPVDGGLDVTKSEFMPGRYIPDAPHAAVTTTTPGPLTQLGHHMHSIPYVGSHLPMSDQALGGAAVGAGAGLAGGLALSHMGTRDDRDPRWFPKTAEAPLEDAFATEALKTAGTLGGALGSIVPSSIVGGIPAGIGNAIGQGAGVRSVGAQYGLTPEETAALQERALGVGSGIGAWARTIPGLAGGAILGGLAGDAIGEGDKSYIGGGAVLGGGLGATALSYPAGRAAGRSAALDAMAPTGGMIRPMPA